MSKPVKQMIMADYKRRFGDLDGALVIDIRGIDANQNNKLRLNLSQNRVRLTVVTNTLAKHALGGTSLSALGPALDGPSALVYGGDSVVDVARQIVGWAKKVELITLKGAVLDGEYFPGEAGVRRLSTFPTREEAQAKVVSLVLGPGGRVLGAAKGPGGRVLGIVKEIEKRLEKGEAIARLELA